MTLRNLIPVKSGYIRALGYKDGEATARFKSGIVRNYPMPVTLFQAWMAADSKGRFFNQFVKRGSRGRAPKTPAFRGELHAKQA